MQSIGCSCGLFEKPSDLLVPAERASVRPCKSLQSAPYPLGMTDCKYTGMTGLANVVPLNSSK